MLEEILAGLFFFNKIDPYMAMEVEDDHGIFYLTVNYHKYNVNPRSLYFLEEKGWIVDSYKISYPLLIKDIS